MSPAFSVVIPARMASIRLPNKPLVDIAGLPMVVRVAQRAAQSGAQHVVVATDDERILVACERFGVRALMTDAHHPSGTDRIAQAARLLGLPDDAVIVNVQGDEPLIDPEHIRSVAQCLSTDPSCNMATLAHPIHAHEDFINPNIVKVVVNALGHALYFSRAPIPWWRDAPSQAPGFKPGQALRHVGLYAYRAGFLQTYAHWPASPVEGIEALEQLRVLDQGHRIAVHVAQTSSGIGVDTPQDLERVRESFTQRPSA